MTPLINGISYSSANVSFVVPILGVVVGITSIDYEADQDIKDNYALGQDPVSRGFGQNSYKSTIEVYKETWNKIIDASPFRNPSMLPLFDITVVYSGNGVEYRKEVLKSVSFKNNPMAVKSGDTKMTCKINLQVAGIEF